MKSNNAKGRVNISELSSSVHTFNQYHFCRGNGNRRKSRFGIIERGEGTYMYLNRKIEVRAGDIIFIPERIFCYSEWRGAPDIKVTYVSCFMNGDSEAFEYEPQKLPHSDGAWDAILEINRLLSGDYLDELRAYSIFYGLLCEFVPNMKRSYICSNKSLQKAVEYIADNWNKDFSVADVARRCAICESKLYNLFRSELGQTPVNYLNSIKINYAIQYLENSDYSISQISRMVNFSSENHFRSVFSSIVGTTPLKYRKQC